MGIRDRMENDPVIVSFGPPSDKLEMIFDEDLDDFVIDETVASGDTMEL